MEGHRPDQTPGDAPQDAEDRSRSGRQRDLLQGGFGHLPNEGVDKMHDAEECGREEPHPHLREAAPRPDEQEPERREFLSEAHEQQHEGCG